MCALLSALGAVVNHCMLVQDYFTLGHKQSYDAAHCAGGRQNDSYSCRLVRRHKLLAMLTLMLSTGVCPQPLSVMHGACALPQLCMFWGPVQLQFGSMDLPYMQHERMMSACGLMNGWLMTVACFERFAQLSTAVCACTTGVPGTAPRLRS
jgi:hypothetical protein